MSKGLILTWDALLCAVLLTGILLASSSPTPPNSWTRLATLQKINDLQKIWAIQETFDETERIQDLQQVFPQSDFTLIQNNQVIHRVQIHPGQTQSISSEMVYLKPNREIIHLTVAVNYQ